MNEDKVTIFGKNIIFHQVTKEHYCIDIFSTFSSCANCQEVLILKTNLFEKEKSSKIEKIHKKFGQASFETMEKLLELVGHISILPTNLRDLVLQPE